MLKVLSFLVFDCSEIINIDSGYELNIKELIEKFAGGVGFRGTIHFNTKFSDGTPRKLLDSAKLRSLGWQPIDDLEEGLNIVYTDFLARG